MQKLIKSINIDGVNFKIKWSAVDIVEISNNAEDDFIGALLDFYGALPSDIEEAIEKFKFFLSGNDIRPKPKNKAPQEEITDFYADFDLLYSAIQREYHINIYDDNLHWFQFLWLVRDMQEKSLYKEVCFSRQRNKGKLSNEEKIRYTRLKMMYPIIKEGSDT